MARGRKEGSGAVRVRGKILTTQDYKNAVFNTLKELGTWVTTDTIISYASSKGWVDDRNRPRRAMSHPLYKIMSIMADVDKSVDWKFNDRGRLEYMLK